MLTVVMLLLLPVVLCLSIVRLALVPRDLLAGRRRINPRWPVIAALALGIVYLALLCQSGLVLYTLAKAIASPPRGLQELFSLASVGAAYPFVYLAFEWVGYYSIAPGVAACPTPAIEARP